MNFRIGVILVLTWLLIAAAALFPAWSQDTYSVTYTPVDDAYVSESDPDANFGSSEDLILERSSDNTWTRAYLKFDLSSLSFSEIVSVTLRLYFEGFKTLVESTYVRVHLVGNDSWEEESITWNSQPVYSSDRVEVNLYGCQINTFIEINITSLVKQNLTNGDKIISLALTFYNPNLDSYVIFSSKEGSYPPELVIEYVPPTTITETTTETQTVTEYVTETITVTTTMTDYITETQTTTVTQTDTIYTTETAYTTETSTVTQTITDVITETATTTITQTETAWVNQTVTITTTITPTTTVTVYGNETVTMTEYGNSTAPEINYQALADALMPIVLIVGVISTLLGLLLQSTNFRRGD